MKISMLSIHTLHYSGVSSRDLSPVDMVREYWSDCKDEMVEDMERIYERYAVTQKIFYLHAKKYFKSINIYG